MPDEGRGEATAERTFYQPGSGAGEYRDGQSEDQYITENAFQFNWKDPSSMSRGAAFGTPLAIQNAYAGRSAYKKGRAAAEDRKNREAAHQRNLEMQTQAHAALGRQQEAANRREATLSNLDQAFNATGRAQQRDQLYNALLAAGAEQAKFQFGQANKQNKMAQAQKGTLGSTMDASAQAANESNLQRSLMETEGQAAERRRQMEESDRARLSNLRRTILSGDPASQQALLSQVQQETGATGNLARLYAGDVAGDQNRWASAVNQSQFIGGLAGAAGSAGASYYDQQARG